MANKTLIANKKLRVELSSTGTDFFVLLNGEKVKDEKGSEIKFTSVEDAQSFAFKTHIRPFVENFFQNFLQIDNPAILTGAGSSLSDDEKAPLGFTMNQLWDSAEKEVKGFNKFAQDMSITKEDGLELLLSKAQMKNTLEQDAALEKSIADVEQHIVGKCSLQLPDNSNHETLFQKLSNRQSSKPRTKVFTLNYDTLFEQAAQRTSTILLDGFSFTHPRHFHSNNLDIDVVHRENSRIQNEGNYLRSVVKFLKLHGSIDWYEKNESTTQSDMAEGKRKLIYPRENKYEQTYNQPFFEMMAQFQQYLRKPNASLVIIGYSFQDKHINSVIKEALISNPMLQIFVVNPTVDSKTAFRSYLIDKTESTSRITLWSATFKDFVSVIPDKTYVSPEEMENL